MSPGAELEADHALRPEPRPAGVGPRSRLHTPPRLHPLPLGGHGMFL